MLTKDWIRRPSSNVTDITTRSPRDDEVPWSSHNCIKKTRTQGYGCEPPTKNLNGILVFHYLVFVCGDSMPVFIFKHIHDATKHIERVFDFDNSIWFIHVEVSICSELDFITYLKFICYHYYTVFIFDDAKLRIIFELAKLFMLKNINSITILILMITSCDQDVMSVTLLSVRHLKISAGCGSRFRSPSPSVMSVTLPTVGHLTILRLTVAFLSVLC